MGLQRTKKWNFPVPVPQTHSKGPNWASDFKNTPHMKIGGGPYLCISVCKSKEVFEVRGCIRNWNSTSMTWKRMRLSFDKKESAPLKNTWKIWRRGWNPTPIFGRQGTGDKLKQFNYLKTMNWIPKWIGLFWGKALMKIEEARDKTTSSRICEGLFKNAMDGTMVFAEISGVNLEREGLKKGSFNMTESGYCSETNVF